MKTVMILNTESEGGYFIFDVVQENDQYVLVKVPDNLSKDVERLCIGRSHPGLDGCSDMQIIPKDRLLPEDFLIEDYTKSNPKYHNLLVSYAMETLEVASRAINELQEHNRVDSSILAGIIQEEITERVKQTAAWREAVWRSACHMNAPTSRLDYPGRKKRANEDTDE